MSKVFPNCKRIVGRECQNAMALHFSFDLKDGYAHFNTE
ncbi:hypothetical protein GLIP_2321 [Aliiglaciecola lipolytica E3]|uniref:Uncharacterized protein n=1 Tax=Aliiglaciecola lipolytica E3 TaxID=1127673 RepID=K6Y9U1_9ALTE|nr:hypothetical protein GLIP_2321 [Aliiglaciecola lipolytica E3]